MATLRLPQRLPIHSPFYLSRRTLQQPKHNLQHQHRRSYASSKSQVTDKSRILGKPDKFRPPSHGNRRVRPRHYTGPQLTEAELKEQEAKRYPNMMPPEGSFLHHFLTDRRLHLFITLGTLTSLALFTTFTSFLANLPKHLRDELPTGTDFWNHPFDAPIQFVSVYKQSVLENSVKTAEMRRQKIADAEKRKEFLTEHGVEPGFLTGSWMGRFGGKEGDEFLENRKKRVEDGAVDIAAENGGGEEVGTAEWPQGNQSEEDYEKQPAQRVQTREKKNVKMWFGIW